MNRYPSNSVTVGIAGPFLLDEGFQTYRPSGIPLNAVCSTLRVAFTLFSWVCLLSLSWSGILQRSSVHR
ncbi:hypothetical protein JAAARDRAFT_30957 [Jaapia argillacea MUCL 33604]|uniref:Uncharacterized protein n=1 Tax=Jaapia argillacea MUCL 33604 TaxID=933084 RepID=A0A067Q3G7_9AGAM|nr:hypothetical protein JAAARDRAFT_30957 [Jaapia argillacea MUCL 33604]